MLVLLSPTIIEQTKKIVDNLLVSKVISNTILRIGKLSHNAIMECKKTFALLTSFRHYCCYQGQHFFEIIVCQIVR
jgi:hypothetical protein